MSHHVELKSTGTPYCITIDAPDATLTAFVVIDSLVLGPALGGIRTMTYVDERAAELDARRLASAMTLKCAIAGLNAGGAKTVVMVRPGMDRALAFRALGARIEQLNGCYHAAGDLGTSDTDLAFVASATRYVATEAVELAEAAGLGVLRCIEACVGHVGRGSIHGLRVVVQGCGDMGGAVARALSCAGAEVLLADVQRERAEALAEALGARAIGAEEVWSVSTDVVAPCAVGGVIDAAVAAATKAWAICGAANNQLAHPDAELTLRARGVLWVPDFLASAGAVIRGAAGRELCPGDWRQVIDGLGLTTRALLEQSRTESKLMSELATEHARRRIDSKSAS